MLCETRWSAKIQIRIFSQHYVAIVEALKKLASMESTSTLQLGNELTSSTVQQQVHLLLFACTLYQSTVHCWNQATNVLQSLSMDFHSAHDHITELQNIFCGQWTNAEEQFSDIMKTASEAATRLNMLISVPRQVSRQAHQPTRD
ncbi:hypothetical protein HPB48_018874 [Haemaphysalis longicornis]|uniref:Uncharacterized protein n=1 Tax=Haemaphysalis longicornis TaxID=44386 RepID=A0A9J6GTZ8_HAELO|nr:hypothetical protein HPB48_018874 [Haemaphysalis longicornis]